MASGVRVVEIGGGIASGYAGRLLAGAGADVVVVEPPEGSALRGPPSVPGTERGALFEHLAMGKRSALLAGAERDRLLATVDVVLDEADGDPAALIGRAERVRAANPSVVYVACSPFGLDGPYARDRSSALVDWAASGYASFTGDPDREPLQGGGPWCAYAAGLTAAIGAQAALATARDTGEGQLVDVSTFAAMAALHQWTIVLATHQGVRKRRAGNRHAESFHPLGLQPCADGWVGIAVSSQRQWEAFCIALDLPELIADERFRSGGARFDNADALDGLIQPWLLARTQREIVDHLQAHQVPASPVLSLAEVLDDEQLASRDYWVPRPELGAVAPGLAVRTPASPDRLQPAPALGAHTADVLAGLPIEPPAPARGAQPRARLPLEGVRVLELSIAWAGPLAGRFLADLGADVIRVEQRLARGVGRAPDGRAPDGEAEGWRWGDLPPPDFRSGVYPVADPGERPWNRQGTFNKMHRNKRSLCVDLKTEAGREAFGRLVAESDVVLDNWRPRALDRLGFDYASLCAINPRIIRASMSGYGATGPYRDRASFGPILEAHSGFADATGYVDGGPMKLGAAFPDGIGGLTGAFAILDALSERQRTGRGAFIDLSQLEAYLAIGGELLLAASASGEAPVRRGNRSPIDAPQGVYPCVGEDEWVALTVRTDADWDRLIALVGADLRDPSLGSLAGREAAHDRIDAAITAWTRTRAKHEAAMELQAAGIAASAVLTNLDLVVDPQLRSRGFFVTIDQEDVGVREFPGFPIHFSGRPVTEFRSAPSLGRDNRAVLVDLLGYSDAECDALAAEGVIADRPPP